MTAKKTAVFLSILICTSILVDCGSTTGGSSREEFPQRSVELVVPFDPGGSTDLMSRALASAAERELGQPITIVNNGGANGTVATTDVANAKPDGYTMAIDTNALVAWQPHLKELQYTVDDFEGIDALGTEPIIMATNANSPWKTLDDLIEEKTSDRTIAFGHAGEGGFPHLAQVEFFKEAGIDASSVPFDGGAPAVTALLGNNVDVVVAGPAELLPQVEAGKLRLLGVFSPERPDFISDVPTFKEKGYDIEYSVSRYLLVPKDTPNEATRVLREVFGKAVESQEFQNFLKTNNFTPLEMSGKEAMEELEKEYRDADEILKELNLGLE